MVEVFSAGGPVATRISSEARIEIAALQDPDVDRFIEGVIRYVREPTVDVNGLVEAAKPTTDETVEPSTFPFTTEAIDALKSRLMTEMLPREIAMRMTRALGRAFRMKELVVTREAIQ